jgi:DinB superfamily
MLITLKELITNQFEAAFSTLNACIDRCPDAAWNAPVANLAFCQVAFHTLFYADFYLGPDEQSFRQQPFHQNHPDFFRDYEELEDRAQRLLYDKPAIKDYLDHCRAKLVEALAPETADTLAGPSGFRRRAVSRAELYVYNMRHIQHHAAQLSLRLRLDSKQEIPWIDSGWREL